MTRATPLPAAERREAILDAVLPLVLEEGRGVSTRRIAEASGIAEGTIFRVFSCKSDLVDEAIRRGLAPGAVIADLRAIVPRSDLRGLVVEVVATLQNHARTAHRLLGLLPPSDAGASHHGMDASATRGIGEQTVDAIADVLADYRDALGVSPRAAAGAILALSFGSTFSTPAAVPAAVADILLYGITRTDKA